MVVTAIGVMALLNRYPAPDLVSWRIAVIVGTVTTAAVLVATWSFGVYLRTVSGAPVTGAFGAVLALLRWVYYEALIMLVGGRRRAAGGGP